MSHTFMKMPIALLYNKTIYHARGQIRHETSGGSRQHDYEMWDDPTEQLRLLRRDETALIRDDDVSRIFKSEYRLLGRRKMQ